MMRSHGHEVWAVTSGSNQELQSWKPDLEVQEGTSGKAGIATICKVNTFHIFTEQSVFLGNFNKLSNTEFLTLSKPQFFKNEDFVLYPFHPIGIRGIDKSP